MTELESGYLKGWLHPEDYDIKQWVSQYERHNLPMGLLLRVPFGRAHLHTYLERVLDSSAHAHFQSRELTARHHHGLQVDLAIPS